MKFGFDCQNIKRFIRAENLASSVRMKFGLNHWLSALHFLFAPRQSIVPAESKIVHRQAECCYSVAG